MQKDLRHITELNKNNIAFVKSYGLSLRCITFCIQIQKDKKEYIITKQLIRSITSICANMQEAVGGQSKRDFYAKLCISYKEARESFYWLSLIDDLELYTNKKEIEYLLEQIYEVLCLLGKSKSTYEKNHA